MNAKRKTARVVLRLDPLGTTTPALRAIAQLAHALDAELAARLVEDSRLVDALAFNAQSVEDVNNARRVERGLRRQIEGVAGDMAWSFDVVRCAGVIAVECALHADDLFAIALPEIEHAMSILRDEISNGLARTSGVLLMPRAQPQPNRPIVGLVTDEAGLSQIVESAADLATRFRQQLSFVVVDDGDLFARVRATAASHWTGPGAVALHPVPTSQMDILAAYVRNLRPKLVVLAPSPESIQELLARPRLLRELGAPILLLRPAQDSDRPE